MLIQGLVSFVIGAIIIKRNPSYKVNQMFGIAFFFYGIFFGVESLWQGMYLFYDSALANLLRDFSLAGGIISSGFILIGIWYLKNDTNELKFFIPVFLLMVTGLIGGTFFDYLYFDQGIDKWVINEDFLAYVFAYSGPAIFIFTCVVLLFLFSRSLKDTDDPVVKKKINLLAFGLFLAVLGTVSFILPVTSTLFLLPEITIGDILLFVEELIVFRALI